jgi:hypothetical protein
MRKEEREMSKKKMNTTPRTQYEVIRSIRGDWGNVNPVTKVIPNKKRNQKPKHKKGWDEE